MIAGEKVTFVEPTDTIPVHGPETEIVDGHAVSEAMTVLNLVHNPHDREVVVLLHKHHPPHRGSRQNGR